MVAIEKPVPRRLKARAQVTEPVEEKKWTFHEELSHLRHAQAALNTGNAALAWGLMQSLDELRPQGALHQEREVTKVLSLCALGRNQAAQKIAERLMQATPHSVYAARLKGSCALLENHDSKPLAGGRNQVGRDTNR